MPANGRNKCQKVYLKNSVLKKKTVRVKNKILCTTTINTILL